MLVCPACNARYEAGGFCAIDGTPLERQTVEQANLVGQVLADRYRIVRLLGEGGMGQVYEASHVNIHRRYAIKMLRPQIVSDAEAVARFRQEAWSASSIGHENIVEIDDFATLPNGSVYLAMEYLDGESLADRLERTPALSLTETVVIFRQVCAGLGAAHEKGIIHRDMKPENIFLHRRGERTVVKILDFGIAKVTVGEANKSLTRTGAIFGTPFYMSPEQALGSPVDARSDIYSVGVMLYEVFGGHVPFVADSFMGILSKHIAQAPQPLHELKPGIASEVEALVMRAIAKDPVQRQPDMAELDRELTALVPFEELVAAMQLPSGPVAIAGFPSGLTPVNARAVLSSSAGLPVQELRVGGGSGSLPVGPTTGSTTGKVDPLAPTFDGSLKAPVQRSFPVLAAVLGGIVLVGVGVGAWIWRSQPPITPPPTTIVANVNPPPVTPPLPPTTVAPEFDEVTLDSVPTGALIIGLPLEADGTQADTPEPVKIPRGQTLAVALHKPGYVDAKVLLDPSHSRKLIVRLEKIVERAPQPLPHLREAPPPDRPVVHQPPPHQNPPVVTQPKQPPQQNQKHSGKSEVLDPYQ